jgi:hypothetical protein
MKNWLKKVWIELSNHNRYKCVAGLVCVFLFFLFNGCQIRTQSIVDPNVKLTVAELQAEIDAFYAKEEAELTRFEALAKARAEDVNDQIRFRQFVYESALSTATSGGLNWLNLLTSAGSLIGAGALADNIRFRRDTKKKEAS